MSDAEEMTTAVRSVLRFTHPSIASVQAIEGEPTMLGLEATDGTLFVLTVEEA